MDRRLKITLIILLIILLSMISFAGIFVQNAKFMENIIPEYKLGMDLRGYRAVTLSPSSETETVYYDKDGNVVEEAAEDGTSEQVPINGEDVLTKDNYNKAKDIMEARLKALGIEEYITRLNENSGEITFYIPEDDMTDMATQFLYSRGMMTVEDEDGQVLLDSSNLKDISVGYRTLNTGYTEVYLTLEMKEDAIQKLKEISNTYVASTNEEGEDTTKSVSVKIDGSELQTHTFENEITDGVWELSLGESTNTSTINAYLNQGATIVILLEDGTIPYEVQLDQNRFIKSDLSLEDGIIPAIVIGAVLLIAIALIVLIVRYKKIGLFGIISFIGYIALLLIVLRLTNVVFTIEGIAGIVLLGILNYILLVYLSERLKKADVADYKNTFNKSFVQILLVLVPTMIIGVVFSFATWLPAISFGTIVFWGMFISAIYNAVITRCLFLNSNKNKV